MKKIFLLSTFSLLLLCSCNKDEPDFNFSGNVKTANSLINTQGVEVKIYTYSSGGNIESLKGSTTTDASGNYELNIERDKYEKVMIQLKKDNYFIKQKVIQFDELSTEDVNSYNHLIDAQSWTKFILKNTSSTDPNDELKIQKISGRTDCDGCWSNGNHIFTGEIDTTIYVPNTGNSYMKFYWWSYGNSSLNAEDSVYTTEFDTIDYTINY